ncbi:sensor histidine kinase [Streptomyces fradiae]|uniref:sensor histidine kinase n=1 Tax=Streptomyces fradiae TaxID=1906 RepID=UPI00294232D0|nr:histidine kinase [Streptomyces fradiae]WOI62520.1 histidine kinase [Streptomyces fradiae]
MESTGGRGPVVWTAWALPVAAATGAALTVRSDWWTVPTAAAAFLAGRRPGGTRAGALALSGAVAAGVLAVLLMPSLLVHATVFVGALVAGAMLPWFAGRFWWQYRELVRAGWERAAHLEREQRLVAEQARLRERARIAQDMHDLLGHELSLIALSAGALQLSPDLTGEQRAAARDIRSRAGAAVERLGEVVGLLREEDAAPEPTPGGGGAPDAGLAELVASAAASGLAVELAVEGAAPAGAGLPPAVGRAVHRVVREALTNAARHAPGAPVTVRLVHGEGGTEVRVVNGPPARDRPGAAPSGGGRGLVGLDERVRLAGGTLRHGPHDGGFAVTATLPHDRLGADGRPGPDGPRVRDEPPGVRDQRSTREPYEPSSARQPRAGRRPRLPRTLRTSPATPLGPRTPLTPHDRPGPPKPHHPHSAPASRTPDASRDRSDAHPAGAAPTAPRGRVPLPQEHRRASVRTRRALVALAVVPVVTGVVLTGALVGWETATASRAVLEPSAYERLRIGQDRSEVARVLPERQLVSHPAVPEPEGEGIACEYYAVTADRFGDRSGDAYRLCFRDGALWSRDVVGP